MTGRAVPGGIDDARLVAALRTGDVIALSEVYDAFAPSLFDYCHGLLRDRVEAAGALRNCLFSAREHVTALGEPQRLRGWLYAIARKESLRRREDPTRSTGQEAPEAGADGMSAQERGRLLERRELAHAALGALDGRQREMLDLAVRHGLAAPDLGKVFGTSPDEADAALRQAHAALAHGLRAALVARRHSRDC
ncbi:sigma-70 family RNA polymerase sigma factor, partial [Spirillospora sp. NPDC049652]